MDAKMIEARLGIRIWSKWDERLYNLRRWFGRSRAGNALYWLRTHTIDRYHIIDIRSPQNEYKWGWIDCSEKIMYASFALLVDFVEKEKAFDTFIDWDYDEDTRGKKKEVMELYSWWKHGRKEENDRSNELFDKIASETKPYETIKQSNGNFELVSHHREHQLYNSWIKSYDALEEKDDEMLMRLVKIRHVLWT